MTTSSLAASLQRTFLHGLLSARQQLPRKLRTAHHERMELRVRSGTQWRSGGATLPDGTDAAREENNATLTVHSSMLSRNSLKEAWSSFRLKGNLPPKMLLPRERESVARGRGWVAANLFPDSVSVRFLQKDGPDHKRQGGHSHRIPQARIDIAGGLAHIDAN